MKGVIYARYSSDNQREESIEGQLRECKEYAERNDITILGTYIDRALSAKTDNRPEFQHMIKESAKGLFDVVLVWKLDRFARNRYDSARYKNLLKKNGVKVISARENISEGSEGIILEAMLEGYAEYYSAELSEKVIRGLTDNALKCKYNGGTVPMGYYIDEQQYYQIDPKTAPVVLEMFTKYSEGATMQELVNLLNSRGMRSIRGGKITLNIMNHLLKNRRYMGEYSYRDVVKENGIPAIVPKELFERVQERLAKNKKAPARHKAEDDYLLTTKLYCGKCGSFMVGESGTSHTMKVHRYYRCVNTKKKKLCDKKAVKKDWIEDLVVNYTMKAIMNDEVMERLIDTLMELQKKESTDLPLLKKQLAETEKGINNMLNAIQAGIFTPSTKQRLDELEETKSQLEVSILQEEMHKPLLTREQIAFFIYRFRKFDVTKREQRQRLIDSFVNAVYLYEDKIILTFNYKDGSKTITLAEVEGSDLSVLGAPKRTTMTKSHGVSFYTSFIQMEKRTKRRMANAIPLCCTIQKNLNALPVGAVLGVHDLDALSLQLIADAVGLRKVFGLLGLVALHDQRVNGGIALAGDGVAAFGLGGLGLGIGFPHCCGFFQQGQAQYLIVAVQNGQLGGVIGLGLQGIIQSSDAHGGVQIIAHLLQELLLVLLEDGLIHGAILRIQGGDLGDQLAVGGCGVVQILPGEYQSLAVVALEAEEAVSQGIVAFFLQQGYGEELALGLAHFAVAGVQVGHMEPLGAPGMAQIAFRLGDFIGVVGESVVDAAAVEVQIFAVILHGDAGALDMPAGIAHTPRRIPLQRLILKLGLGEPEDEVVLVPLVGVLFYALTDADSQILLVVVIKDIITLELAGVEIDVAAGKVGVAGVQQLGDDLDIVINEAGGGLHHVRAFDVQLAAVIKEGIGIVLGHLHDGLVLPVSTLEHLILAFVSVRGQMAHVRDVHDTVDAVAGIAQKLFQHVLHDIAAEVADVGEVIHRGAAGIHFHMARCVGGEFGFLMGGGVVKIHNIHPFRVFV